MARWRDRARHLMQHGCCRDVCRHGAMLALAVAGFVVSATAAQDPLAGAHAADVSASLWSQWLSPYTVISAALILLWVGDLRSDLRRLKEQVRFHDQRLDNLPEQFIPREVLEEKFGSLRADLGRHDSERRS